MITIIKNLTRILNLKHKKHLIIILFFVLIGMLFEVLGVSILVPVITILLESNENNFLISFIKKSFNVQDHLQLLQYVLIFFLFIIIIKSIYLIALSYFKFRFIAKVTNDVTNELFKGYLYNSYQYHLNTNSSILIRNIQIEMTEFNSSLQSLMNVVTEFTIVLGLVIFLLYTEPLGAILTGGVLLLATIFFQIIIKKSLSRWGLKRQALDGKINKVLIQSLSGIKDIKLLRVENYFFNNFFKSVNRKIDLQSKYVTIKNMPRQYLEFIVLMGLLLFIYILIIKGVAPAIIVTTLTLFVGVSFKLIPSFNNLMSSLQQLRFSQHSTRLIKDDLQEIRLANNIKIDTLNLLSFNNSIKFKNVCFTHHATDNIILNDFNFEIKKNSKIGLIGESGSGKSTFADLLMGLLNVNSGDIKVDDVSIYDHLTSWQRNVGYVPQTIYLLDDTILNNIAFGVDSQNICIQSVKDAIRIAQLDNFVNSLQLGLNTNIGEGGAKLSGGQRQRIGIARALYNNPNLLIFDEATSALDNATESNVMEAIYSIKDKTIIIIAHRLSTLMNCDFVYSIELGKAIKKDFFNQ